MSLPRFFCLNLPAEGVVELDSEEAQHASNALRMTEGAAAILFDGQGQEAVAHIQEISRKRAVFMIEKLEAVSRELPGRVEFMVGLPKGDRQKSLVESLVQLGVHKLTPLRCYRSVAKVNEKAAERLQRWVLESSKQCGRNQLMEIGAEQRLEELLGAAAAQDPPTLQLFAHPYEVGHRKPDPLDLSCIAAMRDPSIRILVGPEGGFTKEEAESLVPAGWRPILLGDRILRVETAATSIAALIGASLTNKP